MKKPDINENAAMTIPVGAMWHSLDEVSQQRMVQLATRFADVPTFGLASSVIGSCLGELYQNSDATEAEIIDLLRLLLRQIASQFCPECREPLFDMHTHEAPEAP